MAYFNNQDDDNQNAQGMNQQNPEDQQQNQQQLAGGVSATSAPASTAGPANVTTAKPTSSGMSGFKNIQQANVGKASDRLQDVAGTNVAAQGQRAKTGINQATTSFGKKVDIGSLKNYGQGVQDVKDIVASARQLTTENNQLAQPQQSRFQEVINAKYQGPESLRQSGDYHKASDAVKQAQTALTQTETATGREELLKNLFAKSGNYTQGLNKLDAGILNASNEGINNLQNIAKAQGNIGQQLEQAQIGSANLAQNRAQQMRDIRAQGRAAFTEGRTAEEQATEDRLASVIKNWENLPNHFKDIIRNKGQNYQNIIDSNLTKFKTDNKYDDIVSQQAAAKKAYDTAQAELNAASRKLTPITPTYDLADWTNGIGPGPQATQELAPEQRAAFQEAYNIAKAKADQASAVYNPLTAQKTALDAQLKKIPTQFNKNSITLTPIEAALLGVKSGEGIYQMGADAIKVNAAEKDRLISKNEQLRQAVLAQLAGLDESKQFSTDLRYANAAKAGTQSAADALDLEGTRAALNEAEQGFRDTSKATNIVGQGKKKVSRGNAWGKKTKTYSASVSGNAADMLRKAGYNLDAPIGGGQDTTANSQLLKSALAATDTKRGINPDIADGAQVSAANSIGTMIGGPIGGAIVAGLMGGSYDPLQNFTDSLNGLVPGAGTVIQDVRSELGNVAGAITSPFGSSFSKGIAGAIGGINSGEMKAHGDAVAKQQAITNLKQKYTNYLNNQGFENRFAVSNSDALKERTTLLADLLAKMDRTNT